MHPMIPPKPSEAVTAQPPLGPGPEAPAEREPERFWVYGLDAASGQPCEPLFLEGADEEDVRQQAAALGMAVEEIEPVRPRAQTPPAQLRTGEDFLTFAKYLVDLYGDEEATLEMAVTHLEEREPKHVARDLGLATPDGVYQDLTGLTHLLPPETCLSAILASDGAIDLKDADLSSSGPYYEFSAEQKSEFLSAAQWMRIMGGLVIAAGALMCLGLFALRIDLVLQGVVSIIIGLWTLAAATAFGHVGQITGRDIDYLMNAVANLKKLYRLQVILILVGLALMLLALIVLAGMAANRSVF